MKVYFIKNLIKKIINKDFEMLKTFKNNEWWIKKEFLYKNN
jgi:hypothetical protein